VPEIVGADSCGERLLLLDPNERDTYPLLDGGVDTTLDTTQSATRCDGGQPRAKKFAYIRRFCNFRQRPETDVFGLWLRRARVRVPLVTFTQAGKNQMSVFFCGGCRRLPGTWTIRGPSVTRAAIVSPLREARRTSR
jgi:hypothetical protein